MQSVLFIFPDSHLPYSPTIHHLADALKINFNVKIISFENRQFGRMQEEHIHYLKIHFLRKKVYGLVNRFSKKRGVSILSQFKKWAVQKYLAANKFDHLIVTDPISLWMINGLSINNIHMVSLELTRNTSQYLHLVNMNHLGSLIIQSPERKQALNPNFSKPVFYIQNAPNFNPSIIKKGNPSKHSFIFSGTAFAKFGIFHCLDYLVEYPLANMMVIGKIPPHEQKIINEKFYSLLKNKQLILSNKYFETEELIGEVSKFRIGFCFYNFSDPEINNINYKTAPSGKMFTYFAAGVPVIGINIPGLKPITDFYAGILINQMDTDAIHNAVLAIEENYDEMVKGCYRAAEHFSFNKAIEPFIQFLENSI